VAPGALPIVLVSQRTQPSPNGTAVYHGATHYTLLHASCAMVSYGVATGAWSIALASQRAQPPPNGNATHEATNACTRPTTRAAATSRPEWHTPAMPQTRAMRSSMRSDTPCPRKYQLMDTRRPRAFPLTHGRIGGHARHTWRAMRWAGARVGGGGRGGEALRRDEARIRWGTGRRRGW